MALLVGALALGNPWLVAPAAASPMPSAPLAGSAIEVSEGPGEHHAAEGLAADGHPAVGVPGNSAAVVEAEPGTESEPHGVGAPLAAPASAGHDER